MTKLKNDPNLNKYQKHVKQIREAVRTGQKGKLFTRDILGNSGWQSFIERWQRESFTDEEIDYQLACNLDYELGIEERYYSKQKTNPPALKNKEYNEYDIEEDEYDNEEEDEIKLVKPLIKNRALTISERGVNYLFSQMKMKSLERTGRELDYKLMWAVDFISSEISKRAGFSKDNKGELVLFNSPSQFFDFINKKAEPALVRFKASDVKKYLGFSSDKLSIKDIVNLFEGLQEVFFEIKGERILRDKKGETWKVLGKKRRNLYQLDTLETQTMISNRWKTQDVYITVKFMNELGWMFLQNLSCGTKGRITLPRQARHELDGYQQNILRELRMWVNPKPYNIMELAKIAGLKSKETDKLRKSLVKALEGLKKKRYIKDYKITGRGNETKFTIFK